MSNKNTIISHAFNYLGQGPVSDLETGNPIEASVFSIYNSLYPTLLSMRPWSFALFTQSLDRLTDDPLSNKYQYAFQLPTDPKFLRAYDIAPRQLFEIQGNILLTNNSLVDLTYTRQVEENGLSAPFTTFLEYSLTASIAMLVTQQPEIQKIWEEKSRIAFSVASYTDSAQPNQPIKNQPIYESHFIS